MKNFWRLLRLSYEYRRWMVLAAFTGFLTIGSSIGLLMTSAYIITKAALHPSVGELQVAIVGVRFFGIARGIFRYAERLISHNITFKLLAKFRVWFYKSIEPLAPAGLSNFRSGDLLARMVSDVESLEHVYIRVIFPPFVAILITALMWTLFGIFNVMFSVIITLALAVAGVAVPVFTAKINKVIGERFIEVRSKLKTLSVDLAHGLTELIVYGKEKEFSNEINSLNKEYNKLQFRMSFIDGLNEGLILFVLNLTIIGIMLVGIPQINIGALSGIDLAVMIVGAMASFEAVLPIPTMAQHFESSMRAANRIFEITDKTPSVLNSENPVVNVKSYDLEFKNVSFSYSEGNDSALRNVSFSLPKKKKIAIVGASGSGKSTLLNLTARFYDVTKGAILLGETDIKRIDIEVLRRQFSHVSQSTHIFAGTVEDNLRVGKPEATTEEMTTALIKANVYDTFFEKHNGLKTWLGEGGSKISGGERQRLAIARAILKDAPILVYDEPTANLDSENEQKIIKTILNISEEKSLLFITHRLVSLSEFDEILVMKKGEIVERGTEKDLIAKGGFFKRMLDAQQQVIFQL